jgi:hypothetical protein
MKIFCDSHNAIKMTGDNLRDAAQYDGKNTI